MPPEDSQRASCAWLDDQSSDNKLLVFAVALAFAAVVIFHLASAAAGYPFFRDQHLGAAIEYAKSGIDLMHPVIPGFNATGTGTPQEIPIWQALASIPLRVSAWWGWANVVSLVCFLPACWVAWRLGDYWLGARGGLWVLLAFILQHLVAYTAGVASVDGLALSLAALSLYAMVRFVDAGGWFFGLSAIVWGSLSATSKLPLFMMAGISAAGYAVWRADRRWGRIGGLTGIGMICSGLFFAWNAACDSVLRGALFPHVELSLGGNPAMMRWYFGDLAYRLNPANYIKGGWAALNVLFGSFALVGVCAAGIFSRVKRPALCMLAGGIFTVVVFTHLVLVHRHYYVLFSIPVALFVGGGLLLIEEQFQRRYRASRWFFVPLAAGCLGLATIQGLIGMEVVLNYDPYPRQMAAEIQNRVRPDERILIEGGGWGGQALMLAERDGLSVWAADLLARPDDIQKLKALGFTKLVMIRESPLLWALKKTNPGSAALKRESFSDETLRQLDSWPTLRQTDDILIKQIP